MSTGHDDTRLLLGAYVLGGLDGQDRQRVDDHLPTCTQCRDELARYAPLPALLRAAPVHPPGELDPTDVSTGMLSSLLDRVRDDRRSRRRRTVVRSLVAAAVSVAVVTTGLVITQDRDTGAGVVLAFTSTKGSTAEGDVELISKPWGTELSLQVAQLPGQEHFTLQVTGSDGSQQQAASWAPTPDATANVIGATSLTPQDITTVSVLSQNRPVLRATPGPADLGDTPGCPRSAVGGTDRFPDGRGAYP